MMGQNYDLNLFPLIRFSQQRGEVRPGGVSPNGITCSRDELVVVLIDQGLHVAVQSPNLSHHVRLTIHQLGQRTFSTQLEKQLGAVRVSV